NGVSMGPTGHDASSRTGLPRVVMRQASLERASAAFARRRSCSVSARDAQAPRSARRLAQRYSVMVICRQSRTMIFVMLVPAALPALDDGSVAPADTGSRLLYVGPTLKLAV